jgi:hypothetical protein
MRLAKKGVKVIPEVVILLIGSAGEFDNQKKIVVRIAEKVLTRASMKDLERARSSRPLLPDRNSRPHSYA